MPTRSWISLLAVVWLAALLSACASPNPQPPGLTPVPSLAPGEQATLVPELRGQPTSSAASATGPTDAATGAAIFLRNCTTCHGVQGEGVDGPLLRNSEYIQETDDKDIAATIAGGRSGTEMPAWLQANGGPLTDSQIAAAVAYLHTLQKVPPLPTATPMSMPIEATETPLPPGAPTPEPARPSLPGDPGPGAALPGNAAQGMPLFGQYCAACHGPQGVLGIPNPGSDDGSVPTLKPIDETIVDSDPKVFAANIDLFIEHGSVPSGPSPIIMMPPFGESQMLTPQQIADIIAYVMQLNQ